MKKTRTYFSGTLYLQNFLFTTQSKPGFHFYTSLKAFWEKHFVLGETFLEYVCGACSTDDKPLCEALWQGPQLSRIPLPYPNHDGSYKYHHIANTPTLLSGKLREINDFNPRKQLKTCVGRVSRPS